MSDSMQDDLLRDLVEGEREAMVPRRGAREATWAAVAQSVGEGAAPVIDPSEIARPASVAGGAASWMKILVAIALGGAGVLGVVAVTQSDREPAPVAARAPEQPATPAVAPDSEPEPARENQPEPELPAIEAELPVPAPEDGATTGDATEAVAVPTKREPKPRDHAPRALDAHGPRELVEEPTAATPSSMTTPLRGSSRLAEEARLLAAARAALRKGAHDVALARLAEHAQRFPDGQLTEDRLALRARVFCLRGDIEQGRRARSELQRAFPRSSLLARIDRDCE